MYHLRPPDLDIGQVYPNCARRTRDLTLRNGLLSEAPRVIQRSSVYDELARHKRLHEVTEDACTFVKSSELGEVYDRVLVNGRERAVYDAIRNAARFNRCALCAQRDIQTLDHHLPRARFPEFAVLPINLVPSCFECNSAKSAHVAKSFSEQTFHPYFDDWDDLDLIRASILIEETVYAEFHVNLEDLADCISQRVIKHFQRLDLATLYSEHSSIELVQKRTCFVLTFENGGPEALRSELQREYQSRRHPFPNAWQPALYRALALSEQFVNGGFYAIDDGAPR